MPEFWQPFFLRLRKVALKAIINAKKNLGDNMSLVAVDADNRLQIFAWAIETPKDYQSICLVSKDWKTEGEKALKLVLKEFKQPAEYATPEVEYFKKFYKCITIDGMHYGRRGVYNTLPYKNFLRFARELEKGEGHTPKTRYYLYISECSGGYTTSKLDERNPIFADGNPDTAITPLDYFRKMQNSSGGCGVPGPKHDYEKIYYTIFDNRQKTNPKDEQLKNPCFGEATFYDCDGCSSTPTEKATVIFNFIQGKFHERISQSYS